ADHSTSERRAASNFLNVLTSERVIPLAHEPKHACSFALALWPIGNSSSRGKHPHDPGNERAVAVTTRSRVISHGARSMASQRVLPIEEPVAPIASPDERHGPPGPPPDSDMVWVPGGTFRMGSDAHYPEERPTHRVTVDGFWMDRSPVTNERFAR